MGRHNARVFKNEGTRRTKVKSKKKARKTLNKLRSEQAPDLKREDK